MSGGRAGTEALQRSGWRIASAAAIALLSASCTTSSQNQQPIVETPPPAISAAGDLDVAALQRIAQTAETSGLDAGQVYRRLADRQPGTPGPRTQLAYHLQRTGDLAAAEVEFRQAVTVGPRDLQAWLGLAQNLFAQRRMREAATAYATAAEIDPNNARVLNGLGAVNDSLGRRQEAQDQYRRVLTLDPKDMSARNNLGLSLALAGRFEESIPMLEALAAEPDATDTHRANLARAKAMRDRSGRGRRSASSQPAPPSSTSSGAPMMIQPAP